MLADEDEFLHTVAIVLVPIADKVRSLSHEVAQFVLRHRGIPLAGIPEVHLLASLFKDIAGVRLAIEPADALCTDDGTRPMACNELVKQPHVQRLTTVINESANAIFFCLTLVVVVVVIVVVVGRLTPLPLPS